MLDLLPAPPEVADGSWPFRIHTLERAADVRLVSFEWTHLAAEAIAAGRDGDGLIQLANKSSMTDSATIESLVAVVSQEMSLTMPSRDQAIEALALMVCEYVMVGRLSLEEGLNAIVTLDLFYKEGGPLARFWMLEFDLDAAEAPEWSGVSGDGVAVRVESTMRDFLRATDGCFAGRLVALTSR
jgi:hypothetical protein